MYMSVSEMRAELKALRKSHPEHAPVSKMKKGDLSEIVIPFPPDDAEWKKVAVGTKGYMEHREYAGGLGRLMAICGILARDEKPLVQDLSKAGNRTKVFAPACSYSPAEGE